MVQKRLNNVLLMHCHKERVNAMDDGHRCHSGYKWHQGQMPVLFWFFLAALFFAETLVTVQSHFHTKMQLTTKYSTVQTTKLCTLPDGKYSQSVKILSLIGRPNPSPGALFLSQTTAMDGNGPPLRAHSHTACEVLTQHPLAVSSFCKYGWLSSEQSQLTALYMSKKENYFS